MFDPGFLIIIVCSYVGVLFVIGLYAEKNNFLQNYLCNNALIYSLSLTVYFTTWTFYGLVGFAADTGLLALTFCLGTTITAPFWWLILRKLIYIKNQYAITSVADFISARYNKSAGIAALVTIIAFLGITPYIALQLRSIITTFDIITGATKSTSNFFIQYEGLIVVFLMTIFTIVIGVRRLDPTERHPGIVAAVAFEGIIKLISFILVGIFVVFYLFDGFGDIFHRLCSSSLREHSNFIRPGKFILSEWTTYFIIAMPAFLFLPYQFHITIIENRQENHIKTAMWFIPLYIFLFAIFIIPIAYGGLLKGYLPQEADLFLLRLPLDHDNSFLALIVFIGGFSAATGMIIISSMTMATMLTNHLLLPLVGSFKWLGLIRHNLLFLRWCAVAFFLLVGYWFEQHIERSYSLVNIVTISFVAILQFVPAILGGLFWRKGSKAGAFSGLLLGSLFWFLTLIIPSFIRSGWLPRSILSYGLFGIPFLRPEQLFGISISSPLTHSVFWSLIVNISSYVFISLFLKQSQEEQNVANNFVDVFEMNTQMDYTIHLIPNINMSEKLTIAKELLNQYYSPNIVEDIIQRCINAIHINKKEKITVIELTNLINALEKILSGSFGAPAAHRALKNARLLTNKEASKLPSLYAEILANLNICPEEMRRKINYYQEREILLENQAATLETLVKKRTEQLENAQKELVTKEKMATLGRLTASVSHELRNPLGTIRSSLYSINKRLKGNNEEIDNVLDRAERNIERCDFIIDELLDYTRTKKLHLEDTPIDDWLRDISAELPIHKSITYSTKFESHVTMSIDRERIRRCIINLVNNACQSMVPQEHAHGLSHNNMQEPRLDKKYILAIESRTNDDKLEIRIIDNGPGIPQDKMKKIFEPLFSTRSFGVGLGLSVVKQIMELHKGGIEIKSFINNKTSALLWIPLNRDNP